MTTQDTGREIAEDVHVLADRLARACQAAGLSAKVLAPAQVHASSPDADARLAEVITIASEENHVPSFFWSWGEQICPATEIDRAVAAIKHVVTPPLGSAL